MDKSQIILTALSTNKNAVYSPVQVQKLFFLIDKSIPNFVGGPVFDFKPYNYGPFDIGVYETLENLATEGLANIFEVPGRRWSQFALTEEGQKQGIKLFETLNPKAQNYIKEACKFVLSLNFAELVSAIYKAYPEMKENSVF